MTKVQSHVDTAQCKDSTIKCEEKKREPLNVTKVQSHSVVSTVFCETGTIKFEKKNKGTTKCDKSIVTCDVGTA